jgi:hypothetical protein
MPAISSPGRTGVSIPSLSPRAAPRGFADPGNWYIDHLRHDDLSIFQTIRPENLHFVLNARDKSTIDYEISCSAVDLSGSPVVSEMGPGESGFIGPWRTGWNLRFGSQIIAAGVHTSVSGSLGDDYMKVAGVDWVGYLDQRLYPFDPRPDHVNDYVIGTPPAGLAYEDVSVDASVIINNLWQAIFGRPNSLPLTYGPLTVGLTVPYFRLDLGDTTTLLEQIQDLADFFPGFDFWVDPLTLEFQTAYPYRFGDITALIEAGSTGPNIVYSTDDVVPDSLDFTNTGPAQTHLFGTGSGLASELGTALGTIDGEETFWRTDGQYDAGDVYDQDSLDGLTAQQLSYGLNPIHEISLVLDPARITDFWEKFKPGVAIWVDEDLLFHQIQSPQRVVSIDATVSNDGNVTATIGVNQIYDTSTDAGIPEA